LKKLRLISLLILPFCFPAALSAQRQVSADVEVKTVMDGKVATVTKSVYCTIDGRMVTVFHSPTEYYALTNAKGEFKLYLPGRKEVYSDVDEAASSKGELVNIFMTGSVNDLGLNSFGYTLKSTVTEDGLVKRIFAHRNNPEASQVEVVYKDYLPIFCEYKASSGAVRSRTYFSNYADFKRFTLPCRVTEISYGAKKDSTVVRTIYSNVKVDVDDPAFHFEIPSDAKAVALPSDPAMRRSVK